VIIMISSFQLSSMESDSLRTKLERYNKTVKLGDVF